MLKMECRNKSCVKLRILVGSISEYVCPPMYYYSILCLRVPRRFDA